LIIVDDEERLDFSTGLGELGDVVKAPMKTGDE
jgi:hypothetical protein